MEHRPWWVRLCAGVVGAWAPIFSASALVISLAALKGSYVDPGFDPRFYPVALWLGIGGSLLVGVCWLLLHYGHWLHRDITEGFRAVKRDELSDLLPFYDRVVRAERPSLNDLKEVFNANNQVFRFLEKKTKRDRHTKVEIEGFCTIVPMTREAETLLANEQLNGLKMNRTHVAGPGRAHKVVYIGSVGGDCAKAKAAVLNYVLGLIDDCAARGVTHVYTRPVTQDGLRIAKKYGFHPVKGDAAPDELRRLYVLEIKDRLGAVPRRARKPKAAA